jgi:hypothetical protein
VCAHINTINIYKEQTHSLVGSGLKRITVNQKVLKKIFTKKYKSFSFGSLQFFHVSERVVLFDNSPKWQKNELEFNWNPENKIKKREKERESRHHQCKDNAREL